MTKVRTGIVAGSLLLAGVAYSAGPLTPAALSPALAQASASAGAGSTRLQTAAPTNARASKLFKDSRQTLAIARAQGRRDVVVLIAAVRGGADAVARQAAQLGGDVRYRHDVVDYLRVRIPIDRADALAELDQVEAATLDIDDSFPGRLDAEGGLLQASPPAGPDDPWPPKWPAYPLQHPHSPLAEVGAAALLKQHPTYDGRGVTIAVLDGNLDLLLPEFQTAYTLDGKTVPKIADFLNVTDPRDDAELNPQWVDMRAQVTANDGKVTFQGKTFTAPRAGTFRIGLFNERRFNDPANAAYIEQDVDRNGNPKGDDGLFGVLWDEQTRDVWVDTNRDLSFADQKAMTDYRTRQDVGAFGTDDPKTPVRDSIGFTVQTSPEHKFVSINLGIYQHASGIMGAVVANRAPNGRLNGLAPGARLVSMFWGVGVAHGMIEGLIAAFVHPDVDLIVLEQHSGVASHSYLLADARHPVSIVAQRLIERYKKLMFVPGANAPGFGIVAEDGLAASAVSVGGYQSQESYRMHAGFVPEAVDNLHWGALSHGPSGIGALKPDLLAPSGQMSTDPGYRDGDGIRGLFSLPPGYHVGGGTSTATPMAAGATALLLSAAKQEQVPYDAATLKAALTGSTRYIPRLTAYEQGNGLIQVGPALDLLKKLRTAAPVTIVSRAPVRTRISHLLQTPHEGVGLFEREGWKPGDRGTRTITLTRTSGPAEAMTFALTWEGNDGTFTSASSIALPLNEAVELPVTIAVKEPGPHAAILTLDHPTVPGHAHRVLATVVAAQPLTAENKYTLEQELIVPRPGDRGVFVEVPAGAAALTFSGTTAPVTPGSGVLPANFRLDVVSPHREYYYPCPPAGVPHTPSGQTCVIPQPEPGVWEINVVMNLEARDYDPARERPVKPAAVRVTASAIAVGATTTTDGGAAGAGGAKVGDTLDLPIALTNRFASVSAAASTAALGSAFQTRREIARGEQHVYEVVVPKGATSLRARVSDVADGAADLDLYLLDCTADKKAAEKAGAEKAGVKPPAEKERGNKSPVATPPNCAPKAKSTIVDRGGEVDIADPAPGRWAIVVDAYAVPAGRTAYAYLDVFTHPRLGTVAIADAPDTRAPGAAWTAAGRAWVASLPEAGRTLQARVVVTSRDIRQGSLLNPGSGAAVPLGAVEIALGGGRASSTSSSQGASR